MSIFWSWMRNRTHAQPSRLLRASGLDSAALGSAGHPRTLPYCGHRDLCLRFARLQICKPMSTFSQWSVLASFPCNATKL